MAALSAGTGMVGGITSAIGASRAGEAAGNAAAYRAQIARNNAMLAEQNEKWAEQEGNAEESAQAMKTRAGIGTLKAGMGASGVDVNTGSYADVQDAASALGELDAMTIRSNTSRKVYGYRVEGQNQETAAKLADYEADNARSSGKLGFLSSLLSTASSVGGRYAGWQRTYGPTGVAK